MTIDEAKAQAKALRTALFNRGTTISHARALELVAQQNGAQDWNTLHARLALRNARAPLILGPGAGSSISDRRLPVWLSACLARRGIAGSNSGSITRLMSCSLTGSRTCGGKSWPRSTRKGRSLRHMSDGKPHLLVAKDG